MKQCSLEERHAIEGVLGKKFTEGTVQFSFLEFEQGLQQTRFAPVDMKAVLEGYFGEKLLTNQERKKERQEEKEEFFSRISGYFLEQAGRKAAASLWVKHMISERKHGYQLLMKEYGKDKEQAEALARNVGNALVKLEELKETNEECPLAVFAAEISDNPHYFDRGTTAGLLLTHAICYREKTKLPEDAHQWRELLARVSLVPDNVSSMVHAYGLRLRTELGWHPAYDAFCSLDEPYVVTMENLRGVTGAHAVGERVYVVENEMVFSYLLSNLEHRKVTLLCTSGQPRSVAQLVLSHLRADGAEIYYNGDIDPDGIRIADRLWQKFGGGIHIWKMSPADYEKSISKEPIGDLGRKKLAHISHPVLRKTAECVKQKGLAGYQENMLMELLKGMAE